MSSAEAPRDRGHLAVVNLVAIARVKSGDPAGKRVTMCLTDAGERDCATGNDGEVSVTMTINLRE